jgi:signal transduction histidine kinase
MSESLLHKARVLIVDDEPSNIRLLERVLEMFGCAAVRSTTDSRQTLPFYFEFQPDLVLLDLHMPNLDGYAVLAQLKSAVPAEDYLPVLVLTADVTIDTKRRALAAGAKDLVTKPLDNFEVVLRINNLLENRFLHVELQKQNQTLEGQVRERTAQLEDLLNELRSTQEQVVKQERLRALGMMAGGIAHDFNNALTMVLGYGELLLPYMLQNGPDREVAYLRHMIAAAQDATHVVSRLREFYRPATCNDVRVPVDLNEIAHQAVSLTSPKWKGKSRADGVQIQVETDLRAEALVAGNASELREVLTNLIFNAVDAMPNGGSIKVRTTTHDATATISVEDSGTGMSDEDLSRCLEPFFTTKGERGTGLGLAVVYGIIQRHGGSIDVESELGRGTKFTISLPVTASVSEMNVDVVEAAVAQSLRILVADDQDVICELIAEYLRADGHEVEVAFDGSAALEKFGKGSFDLVVTDQSMPGMSGEQLAKAIHEVAAGTPVVLLTGFGDEMQARGTLPEGITLIVGKPISAAELRRAVLQASGSDEPQAQAAA